MLRDMFLNENHKENFMVLMRESGKKNVDRIYGAFFYLLAGNEELFSLRKKIYNVKKDMIQTDFIMNNQCCSSVQALMLLSADLFNGFTSENISITGLFRNLDEHNTRLAINAINYRFE